MEIVSRTFLDNWEPPISRKNNQKLEKQSFEFFDKKIKNSRTKKSGSGGEIYTVFDEESESEVKKWKILEPGEKK